MSSWSSIALSGLVAFLVPFLMARFPPSYASRFDGVNLSRRNRWIKWGLYVWFLVPMASILPIYSHFGVPNNSLTPAVSLFSVGFLAPLLWVLACTLPNGWLRLAEFFRYLELNDRVTGWVHCFVFGALAAAGTVGLVWDLPRTIEWWLLVKATRGGVA